MAARSRYGTSQPLKGMYSNGSLLLTFQTAVLTVTLDVPNVLAAISTVPAAKLAAEDRERPPGQT
eukprot:1848120-Heterocapsa_arctica.AAC.1